MQIGVTVRQRACERALEMQAEKSGGDDNGQWSKRAVGFLEDTDFGCEGGFQRGLERAEIDFAWR